MKEKLLNISMLGEFTISCGDIVVGDTLRRSKKIWTLIEYLIVFRDKEISQNDLIELLWREEDDSLNPTGAIKTLLNRTRTVLEELGCGRDIIIQKNGSYAWNKDIPIVIDIDEFEHLCEMYFSANEITDKELNLGVAAVDIYKGDFLPSNSLETWAVPLVTYYHSLYLRLIHSLIEELVDLSRWDNIITICKKGVLIDQFDENIHYYLIKALAQKGEYQSAITQYDYMLNLFYNRLGVNPSDETIALYREIVATSNSVEIDLGKIKLELREVENREGAYFCQYEIFKDIYRIESRSIARTGSSIIICLITVTDVKGKVPKIEVVSKSTKELQESIRICLRRGDVFTKYSVSQFLIMLPNITIEDSDVVINRVIKHFKKNNMRLPVNINYKIQPLEPQIL